MDTIYAQATASGKAGVAIVRISGVKAFDAAEVLCGPLPDDRGVRRVVDPTTIEFIDEALVLLFQKGKSFTGEDTVEIHLHGSPIILKKVLGCLSEISGLRHAEAGEFTRRALENGRLDLAQVEGLADLIDAETEAQHRQATRVFQGELGQKADAWRSKLVRGAALVEATIDFADEDVPVDVSPEVRDLITTVRADLIGQIEGVRAAELVRNGFEVAIVGQPNVGKSTLINYLAGRSVAITSDIPGTTRDVIEARLDIGGYAVSFLDTAGVHSTDDPIEKLGVELARSRAEAADLRIFLLGPGHDPILTPSEQDILVQSKSDICATDEFGISGVTGDGIDELIQMLTSRFEQLSSGAGLAVRERHRLAMKIAVDHLDQATLLLEESLNEDICAYELGQAANALGGIVGRIDVEDLLDEVFQSFCIGK